MCTVGRTGCFQLRSLFNNTVRYRIDRPLGLDNGASLRVLVHSVLLPLTAQKCTRWTSLGALAGASYPSWINTLRGESHTFQQMMLNLGLNIQYSIQ